MAWSFEQPKEEERALDSGMIKETALKLLAYCGKNEWAGYDPYDALNSRLFRLLPIWNSKIARLALTQAVKRCPVNLRPLLMVPKSPNPKGIALFLSSLIRLSRSGLEIVDRLVEPMADRLLALRSSKSPHSCWGYNFDWQTRSELVPKGSPNIICSTFAANSLLDAYEQSAKFSWLNEAVSAADFILNNLYWKDSGSNVHFSYTLTNRTPVHNANLLGAALLCRVSRVSGQQRFLQPALAAARYSISRQHEDGSWDYGESLSQRWIDNFHTGFNLVALNRIAKFCGTTEFETCIRRGFKFYKDHFFREDGAPRYFQNATYPIDIHSIAQSVITLVELREGGEHNLELAQSVLTWGMRHMWDARGFFYYQQKPLYTVRTSFMRWSQAWMLLALSTLLEAIQ